MPGRVLVVDDEAVARELMLGALAALGVPGGEEALARLDELAPTLVVLDLMRPGMDGFQVLERLRHTCAGASCRCPVWTAAALADDKLAALHRSAQAIVVKRVAGAGWASCSMRCCAGWPCSRGSGPRERAG
jgi:CheY-like chemotaxis protein